MVLVDQSNQSIVVFLIILPYNKNMKSQTHFLETDDFAI